jgi:hypothetical protein
VDEIPLASFRTNILKKAGKVKNFSKRLEKKI